MAGINILSRPGDSDEADSNWVLEVYLILMRSGFVQEARLVWVGQRS